MIPVSLINANTASLLVVRSVTSRPSRASSPGSGRCGITSRRSDAVDESGGDDGDPDQGRLRRLSNLRNPPGRPTMSLFRLLPAWFHAIADYAVAGALIIVAGAAGGTGKAVGVGIVIGLVVLA